MRTNAKLCGSCGFGSRDEKCVICGKPFAKEIAYLCSQCGFGAKGDHCAKCGRPFAKIQAKLCSVCARKFGGKCIKCGKRA